MDEMERNGLMQLVIQVWCSTSVFTEVLFYIKSPDAKATGLLLTQPKPTFIKKLLY